MLYLNEENVHADALDATVGIIIDAMARALFDPEPLLPRPRAAIATALTPVASPPRRRPRGDRRERAPRPSLETPLLPYRRPAHYVPLPSARGRRAPSPHQRRILAIQRTDVSRETSRTERATVPASAAPAQCSRAAFAPANARRGGGARWALSPPHRAHTRERKGRRAPFPHRHRTLAIWRTNVSRETFSRGTRYRAHTRERKRNPRLPRPRAP